jgi:membrane-associated phospholipid phosphatase
MNWAEHMLSSLLAIRGARRRSWFLVGLVINCSLIASAQTPGDQQTVPAAPPRSQAQPVQFEQPPVDLKSLPRNIFLDQKNIVTAPFHFTVSEWQWTVPLAFVGAGLLASDTAIEKHVPMNPSTVSHAVTASNAGVAAFAAVGGGMFLWGHFTSNDQERETGLLSGEAAIDALLDTEVLKYASGRERPFTGNDRGQFFQGGSSFPSEHSSVSWAIASVIAHEYPGPLTEFLAYGLAGGVGAARLVGHQHFATDVLVGSAIGWYTGRQVFRSHSHYSNAEIARWGTFRKTEDTDSGHEASNMGSSYVPLDSWIYPAMERLIATGYIQSADLGMRPWTRMECARLLQEANQATQDNSDQGNQPRKIYAALAGEFSDEMAGLAGAENLGVDLDSVYTRATQIVGQPLHDSLNFGQTIVNDYGRPYGQGFNNITGFSAHAVVGPLSFYVRSEYQHAPSISPLSAQAAQIFPGIDAVPPPPATPVPAINQVDLLEGYVGMQLDDWQITFGKQSLWWGADKSGPMLLSTNAEPILMLQLDRVKPFKLPLLGDIRVDYLVGRLGGYHFVFGQNSGLIGSWTSSLSDQPFILGEKVSLKPTPDLELGFSVTALFGGPGVPATLHKLLQAGFSTGNGLPGTPSDPGDRRGGFDLNYRVPGMRDWLSFYADAFTDDEPNPWLAWNKAALTSGLYLSRVPGIQKLDFRVEGVYTDPPGSRTTQHGFFYDNDRFLSGYTNNGNLIGSWIGRQGQGADAWTSYWINPKSKVQFNFRHQKVSKEFLLYGGSLTDFGVSGDYRLTSNFYLSAWVQHERWLFPVIQSNVSRNVTASVQISFEPQKLFRRSAADSPTQQP